MRILLTACIVLIAGLAQAQTTAATSSQPARTRPAAPSLRLVQSIPMPDVKGRLDHMAVDPVHQQLFVAAVDNNTLEVLDLAAGKRAKSARGFAAPQGLACLPEQDILVVTNGKTGLVQFLKRDSFKQVDYFKFEDDADNVRYVPSAGKVFAGYNGAMACFDAAGHHWLMDFSMGGHPEGFQVETHGMRVFVNVPNSPDGPHVTVLLRRDPVRWAIMDSWPLTDAKQNYPMALDEDHHRLFVGCREPAVLLTFEINSGKVVDRTPIDGDADDMFYDTSARRLYISCGKGALDIVQQKDPDHYAVIERLPTAPGARTSLFVPQTRRLYLAVPQRDQRPAEVRVYEAATNSADSGTQPSDPPR